MSVRAELFAALTGDATLGTIIGDRVYGAGSVSTPPARPWIAIRTGSEDPALRDDRTPVATRLRASVYVYDEPGSYVRIDAILSHVRRILLGMAPSALALCCEWAGDGPELADDELKSILRVGSYTLIGVS